MLLAIDCGNTNIVFAIYEGDEQRASWRISSESRRSTDEYVVWLTQLMTLRNINVDDITGVMIASVVPDIQPKLVALAHRGFDLVPLCVDGSNVDLGIAINIDRPEQAGADRLVNAVAAAAWHNLPAIVVDFGTATTFDVIIKNTYHGGVIAPGISLSLNNLVNKASLIPMINLSKISKVVGTNTDLAVRSGFYWGYIGLINNIIRQLPHICNTCVELKSI